MTPTYATWKPVTLPVIPTLLIIISAALFAVASTYGDGSASLLFALLIALL